MRADLLCLTAFSYFFSWDHIRANRCQMSGSLPSGSLFSLADTEQKSRTRCCLWNQDPSDFEALSVHFSICNRGTIYKWTSARPNLL